MKPYASYKPSGVPWLGDVPSHWDVNHIRHVLVMHYGDALAADVRVDGDVPVYGSNGVVGTHNTGNTDAPAIIVGRKGSYGKLNFSESAAFCIDTAYHIGAKDCDGCLLRFIYYALMPLGLDTTSQDTGVPGLSRDIAYRTKISIPPLNEQLAIADYLDVETARIDTLIHEKDELSGLLREARSSRISELISGDSLPGKPTGNPWAPHLPDGWKFKRLKHLAQVRSGLAKGKDSGSNATVELPYLRVANVQEGRLDLREISTMSVEVDAVERFSLEEGDVLMNEGGDYDKVGRGAMWTGEISPCLHQNHVFAVRPVERDFSEWLSAITQTQYAKFYFMNNAKQSTNLASISQTTVKELPILLPPKAQRDALLGTLGAELAAFDNLIAHTNDEITLLKELRAATIADAVLGRIDVRTAHTIPLACRETQ